MLADFTTTPAARKGTKVVRLLQGSKFNQGRTAVESFVRQFAIQKAATPFALFVIDFTVFTGPAVWLLTSSTWRSSPSINQGGIVASLLTHSSGLFLVGVVLAAVVCFFCVQGAAVLIRGDRVQFRGSRYSRLQPTDPVG